MALAGLMLYATVISVVGVVRRVQLTRREALSIAITAALCGLFAYLCTLPLSVCVSCACRVVCVHIGVERVEGDEGSEQGSRSRVALLFHPIHVRPIKRPVDRIQLKTTKDTAR
jgi:hypothetical protein